MSDSKGVLFCCCMHADLQSCMGNEGMCRQGNVAAMMFVRFMHASCLAERSAINGEKSPEASHAVCLHASTGPYDNFEIGRDR